MLIAKAVARGRSQAMQEKWQGTMTAINLNIAANGRMVLPKSVRDAMGLHGAAKLTVIMDDTGVRLESPYSGWSARVRFTGSQSRRRVQWKISCATAVPRPSMKTLASNAGANDRGRTGFVGGACSISGQCAHSSRSERRRHRSHGNRHRRTAAGIGVRAPVRRRNNRRS